jgi:hypothetical protein
MRDELPILVAESKDDRTIGCFTEPLTLQTEGSLMPAITELRDDGPAGQKTPLPDQLGRDSAEETTSTLALRTVSHTILVVLAALPELSMPLARLFGPGRLPFLSIAGIVARSRIARIAVCLSFAAATAYVGARVITADNSGRQDVLIGAIVSPAVLAMGISLLVIIGTLIVPAWRFGRRPKRARQTWVQLAAAMLLASGAVVAVTSGMATLGAAQTLTGSGGFKPHRWVVGLVFVAAGFGVAGVRRLTPVIGVVEKLERRRTWGTAAVVSIVALVLLVWSAPHVVHAANDGGWHTAAALTTVVSATTLAVYAFSSELKNALRWIRRRLIP